MDFHREGSLSTIPLIGYHFLFQLCLYLLYLLKWARITQVLFSGTHQESTPSAAVIADEEQMNASKF